MEQLHTKKYVNVCVCVCVCVWKYTEVKLGEGCAGLSSGT